jgi:hypothetical protein
MLHQASMLFSAFVMLMGVGWYGLHTQDGGQPIGETYDAEPNPEQVASLSYAAPEEIAASAQ